MNTGLSIVLLRISRRGSGYCAPPRVCFRKVRELTAVRPGESGHESNVSAAMGGRTDQVISKSEFAFDVGRKMDLMPVQR